GLGTPRGGGTLAYVQSDYGKGETCQGFKAAVAITQVEIIRIRFEANTAAVDGPETLLLRQTQRAQEQRIQYAKHYGVGAYGQSQRQNRRQGKSGRLAQQAQTEANILQQSLNPWQSSLGPVVLFDRLYGAELQDGLASRLNWRESGAKIFLGLQRNVLFNFFFDSRVVRPARPQIGYASEKTLQRIHDRSSALAAKNRSMIAAVWFQSRVSACNCLRPARVSR